MAHDVPYYCKMPKREDDTGAVSKGNAFGRGARLPNLFDVHQKTTLLDVDQPRHCPLTKSGPLGFHQTGRPRSNHSVHFRQGAA